MVTVLIAGGGTGGHVFPMIAVGDALRTIASDVDVVYVGTSRGLEAKVIPERGDRLELMDILPLRGGGLTGFVRGSLRAAWSIPSARTLVQKLAPNVVLSVGGYAAGPVSLAARTLGVPIALLEPNSVLGFANKLLSPLAKRAYTAFPEVERFLRPSVVLRAGVPLRGRFSESAYRAGAGPMKLLVIGGSLGAKALNEVIPRAVAAASSRNVALEVVHQTGRGRDESVRALYASLGFESVTVLPFVDDVAGELARADVVVARAGASSCAELCAVGRAAILVPYPFAVDNHQLRNARSLERAGAAIAIEQASASEERLTNEFTRLALDPGLRARMASSAATLGKRDAARDIAADLLALARQSRRSN